MLRLEGICHHMIYVKGAWVHYHNDSWVRIGGELSNCVEWQPSHAW